LESESLVALIEFILTLISWLNLVSRPIGLWFFHFNCLLQSKLCIQ